jgi:hypothetical protein
VAQLGLCFFSFSRTSRPRGPQSRSLAFLPLPSPACLRPIISTRSPLSQPTSPTALSLFCFIPAADKWGPLVRPSSYLQHPFPLPCSQAAALSAVSRAVRLPPSFKTSINAR